MALTLAFDVYGTLINTSGVYESVKRLVGNKADSFIQIWRDKQLEYSFRKGCMGIYEGFSACTRYALDYTCEVLAVSLSHEEKRALMGEYSKLPAFSDAQETLTALTSSPHRLFAFSNGEPEALQQLLHHAGILALFEDVISVDPIQTFKPHPKVYHYFLEQTKSKADDTWLISGNPFDVMGALNAGLKSAWVKRNPDKIFDPWGMSPTKTISSLADIQKW
ncbi:MAG: haloacid dehalogenase type II [Bacteroidota bacterium]